MTEQLPTPARVSVLPETVQTPGVVDAKVTGSSDDEDAFSVMVAELNDTLFSGAKVIVCDCFVMAKLWTTDRAAE